MLQLIIFCTYQMNTITLLSTFHSDCLNVLCYFKGKLWLWCKVLLLLAPEAWGPKSNSNYDRHAVTSVKGNAHHFGSLVHFF